MDNSDNHRSKVPIQLSVKSELEPVTCNGFYSEQVDGFVMEFSIGTDNYEIEHTASYTRLKTRGLLSYDIVFGDGETASKLSTPFGEMNLSVSDSERLVTPSDDGVSVNLKYTLFTEGVGKIERNVDVVARFLR